MLLTSRWVIRTNCMKVGLYIGPRHRLVLLHQHRRSQMSSSDQACGMRCIDLRNVAMLMDSVDSSCDLITMLCGRCMVFTSALELA